MGSKNKPVINLVIWTLTGCRKFEILRFSHFFARAVKEFIINNTEIKQHFPAIQVTIRSTWKDQLNRAQHDMFRKQTGIASPRLASPRPVSAKKNQTKYRKIRIKAPIKVTLHYWKIQLKYTKSYERECISRYMGTSYESSQNCTTCWLVRFEDFQNITKCTSDFIRFFIYYRLNDITPSLCFHSNFRIELYHHYFIYNLFMHLPIGNLSKDDD